MKVRFITSFNSATYESLYELFNPQLKARNTIGKIKNTFEGLKKQTGDILEMELYKNEGNTYIFWSHHAYTTLEITFEINGNGKLSKFEITNPSPVKEPILERNITKMKLPLEGAWYVFWGGKNVINNYHVAHKTQQGAFDFVVKDERGSLYKNGGRKNEDYYAWGKKIIAPCDGKIIRVIKGVKDNIWPRMNRKQAYGNALVLETQHKEYVVFAHLMYNSIQVKEGQMVRQGETLGLCGNSGNSTDPHLHFSIQNRAAFGIATGAWCYFDKLLVNGTLQHDYMPVRGETIKNF